MGDDAYRIGPYMFFLLREKNSNKYSDYFAAASQMGCVEGMFALLVVGFAMGKIILAYTTLSNRWHIG